jgi:hypothetical protein
MRLFALRKAAMVPARSAVAAVSLAGRSAALANPACATATTATTCTFGPTGAEQTSTLRPGVTAVTIPADGAVGAGPLPRL